MSYTRNLLYIPDYNDLPKGKYGDLFYSNLPKDEWVRFVINGNYRQDDCAKALQQIKTVVAEKNIGLIVGEGVGGYLAMLVTGVRRVVLNPCISPRHELRQIGRRNGHAAPTQKTIDSYEAFKSQLLTYDDNEKKLIDVIAGNKQMRFKDIERGISRNRPTLDCIMHIMDETIQNYCHEKYPGAKYLEEAHKASFGNMVSIRRSRMCGCFYCMSIYPQEMVRNFSQEWNGEYTAWCPYCRIDSVIGDASGYPVGKEFLRVMNEFAF